VHRRTRLQRDTALVSECALVGETGSGKSTQVAQYIAEALLRPDKKVRTAAFGAPTDNCANAMSNVISIPAC
jgi:ABC-type dipeptide/oligopeptide/nickel transport system ATPase component